MEKARGKPKRTQVPLVEDFEKKKKYMCSVHVLGNKKKKKLYAYRGQIPKCLRLENETMPVASPD